MIAARIRRMPRRRQKIALKRLLFNNLKHLIGQPYSMLLGAEIERIILDTVGPPIAEVKITPVPALNRIEVRL